MDDNQKLRRIGVLEALIDLILGLPKEDFVDIANGYADGQREHAEAAADFSAHVTETLAKCEQVLDGAIEEIAELVK